MGASPASHATSTKTQAPSAASTSTPISASTPASTVPTAAPLAAASDAAASRPLPTCDDYARWARMTPEQIVRDCEVQVFRATGPGGQGVNTTDSAVRMRHVPSGITVVSRESRSQHQNRLTCLAKLAEQFERRSHPAKKRAKTKVSRAQKERRLHAKHRVAQKKALRGRVNGGED